MAGNRCPQCNKFVSCDYEAEATSDPEVESHDSDGTLQITLTITINKVCAECGETLATKDVEVIDNTDKSDFEEA